jgi:adenylate kinase
MDAGRREVVFLIDTREDVIISRLASRRVCPGCEAIYNVVTKRPVRADVCDACATGLVVRNDDRPEVIAKRMQTYHIKTEPLIAYYEGKGVLHRIDGNGTVEEAFRAVRAVLDREIRGAKGSQARP